MSSLLPRLRARHARHAAILSVALLVLLIADNVRWAMWIDDNAITRETFHRSSKRLSRVATQERNVAISGRLAVFYLLAEKVGRARVVIPEQFAEHTWLFERVARFDVVVEASALRVDPSRVEALRASSTFTTDWFVRGKRRATRRYGAFHVQVDPETPEYVLGTTPRDVDLFLLPRDVFDANRDGVGPATP